MPTEMKKQKTKRLGDGEEEIHDQNIGSCSDKGPRCVTIL